MLLKCAVNVDNYKAHLTLNTPGFMATNNTDEQGTRDAFFNHRKRTPGDYLTMAIETINS